MNELARSAPVAILVLGMHRSGTSATTRVLNLMGVDLNDELIAAEADNNAKGFWESTGANQIHEELLQALGRTWHDMRELPADWLNAPATHLARHKLRVLLERDFAQSKLWAVKDPRACRFAPMWIQLLHEMGVAVRALFVARDPREVVESLRKRDGWDPGHSYLLWAQHVLEAEMATRDCPRALMTYNDLMSDWRACVTSIGEQLGIEWPRQIDEAAADVEAFLDVGERHQDMKLGASSVAPPPSLISRMDATCGHIAQTHKGWEELASLYSEYRNAADLFGAPVADLARREHAASMELMEASRRLAEKESITSALASLQSSMQSQSDGQLARVEQLTTELHDTAQRVTGLTDGFKNLEAGLGNVETRMGCHDDGLTRLQGHQQMTSDAVANLDRRIAEGVADLDRRLAGGIESLSSAMDEMSERVQRLVEAVGHETARSDTRDAEVQRLRGEAADRERYLADIMDSTSWRITAPMRWVRRLLSPRGFRSAMGRAAKRSYDALPVSKTSKMAFKGAVFTSLSPLFKRTRSYQAWAANTAHATPATSVPTAVVTHHVPASVDHVHRGVKKESAHIYVPIAQTEVDRSHLRARAIAFYLPQFHPVRENDEWWGKGFTEWTNVSKAVPQFAGHYQPHLPGELGFYDLRIPDVMRRQVELAKLYGLEGFCFHYYWFGGRRILERPLQQYVADEQIDFPYCICWANENWTRRWDGLDHDVLLAQQHSPEDDIAFIKELDSMLRDSRYIRIDGKPLVILYRPSLLPDAAATARRWRDYCHESGIGEIFLGMVQFDEPDPRKYGFDAAIEFPPHRVAGGLAPLNPGLEFFNPEYAGHVVDYSDVVERAKAVTAPNYPLIRGVFPSWDNDARKPGRGYTFANSNPQLYRGWLNFAIEYAQGHPVGGEQVVFINAWNEWGEGAHLEPDRKFGYAYLQATRDALSPRRPLWKGPRARLESPGSSSTPAVDGVCVVIHAYYPDLLPEILELLSQWDVPHRIIVTTVPNKRSEVEDFLAHVSVPSKVVVFENRGRDVLPFMNVAEEALACGEQLILKLHTKRSLHRGDGDTWRADLLSKLVDARSAKRIYDAFCATPELGLVAPEGHVLSMTTYWGGNKDRVNEICRDMGLPNVRPEHDWFAAGSMFYVRSEALRALLQLPFAEGDFEAEAGQVDGTLAHAIERAFSIAVRESGYFIAESNKPTSPVGNGRTDYGYAARSDTK